MALLTLSKCQVRPFSAPGVRTTSYRPARLLCRAEAPVSISQGAKLRPLSLHVGETTIEVPFYSDNAQQLDSSFKKLIETFAAKQQATRPKRWEMMEYRVQGAPGSSDVEHFEVFCNPNAYPTAFDAKVLLTLRTRDGLKITTEARLSSMKSDIDAFLTSAV